MKAALLQREQNQKNSSEEFWQSLLTEHTGGLSQVLAYPILMVATKAYVGGKRFDNKGGKVVDFLARAAATGGVTIITFDEPRIRSQFEHLHDSPPLKTTRGEHFLIRRCGAPRLWFTDF